MPSAALRLRDLRAIQTLTQECRDLGDAAPLWSVHLAHGLAGLIGADFGGCGEVGGLGTDRVTTHGIGEWGWENGFDRAAWQESIAEFDRNPFHSAPYRRYFAHMAADDGACEARSDLVGDNGWYQSPFYQRLSQPMGVDHYLMCFRSLPQAAGRHGGMVLARATGAADFSAREKTIVREAHAGVSPLVGGALARFDEPGPAGLPPRVRAVLRCLLEGDSDKLTSARLGLARYTVNEYAKAIYRHFGVNSRAELLARWVKRGWGARFAWSDAD